jgi:hypothetical protein
MKNLLGLLGLIIICSCSQESTNQEPVTDEDGWIHLLDESLSAWEMIGTPQTHWENGVLSVSSSESGSTSLLVSKMKFDNFHLSFDIQTSDVQSLILFRFNDKLKSTPDRAGYLVSTDANPDQQNPFGSIVEVARSTIPENFDASTWNTVDIEASRTLLTVSINGTRVAITNDDQFGNGKIALMVPTATGAAVQYRNMKVQELITVQVVEELLENKYRSDDTREWQSLFDGTSLNGWNPVGDGSWEVQEGVIHGYSGEEGGFLVSKSVFRNFYLKTQFKIIKEDNSGIFIRKSPDSLAVTITDAIECNIYDHNGPSHAYSTGSVATHARAWYGMVDYQDWNEMEIFAEDDHIVMFVNGRKSSEVYLPERFNKAGNICLQGGIKVFAEDQGPSDIYFKEVSVKSFD